MVTAKDRKTLPRLSGERWFEEDAMKSAIALATALVVALPAASAAQNMRKGSGGTGHTITMPDAVKWGPPPPFMPPGSQMAVMLGDPAKKGLFIIRGKLPDGYTIPPHWHSTVENVTVLSGTFNVGMGDKLDKSNRLLKNLVLERFSWRCGSKKRSDGSRSALHRRRWLRFCLIFDAPDGLIPLRPEAWGRERDCRRQQSGRRTIPPSRAHDAGSCANRRRSSSSQRVLRSACA